MVLFREGGQAELVVFRITEVFLREDVPLVLHALRLVHQLADLARLYFLSLVLLRYDVFLNSLVNHGVVLAFCVLLRIPFPLCRPDLHRAHHLVVRNYQVFVAVLDNCRTASSVQPLLVVVEQRHSNGVGFMLVL